MISDHSTGNVCMICADHHYRSGQIKYRSDLLAQYSHFSTYVPQLEVVKI